jgi:predicted DNA binding protein
MLEVHARDPEALAGLLAEYARIGGDLLYEEDDHTAALVRFPVCGCCRTGRVIPTVEGLGYLNLPPSAYGAEGERYQFLVAGDQLDAGLRDRLDAGVELVRAGTRPLTALTFEEGFLVPVGALSGALTPRQRAALVTAILRGYYRIPRAVSAEELARGFGISRPGFDTLLRKAESKLATALFPYLTVQGEATWVGESPPGQP